MLWAAASVASHADRRSACDGVGLVALETAPSRDWRATCCDAETTVGVCVRERVVMMLGADGDVPGVLALHSHEAGVNAFVLVGLP